MKRRNTVSVTPAIGARTVAGETVTEPIWSVFGTTFAGALSRAGAPPPPLPVLSQNLRIRIFYFALQNRRGGGKIRVPLGRIMFIKLREVLLTQYIGAFLIALLVWQAAVEIVTRIVRIGYWLAYKQHPSLFGGYSRDPFRWGGLVLTIVSVGIYLAAAYGLGRWLYPLEVSKITDRSETPIVAPEEP